MIQVHHEQNGTITLNWMGLIIGQVRPHDGEVMLIEDILERLSDDDLLFLMRIGRKPELWRGKRDEP